MRLTLRTLLAYMDEILDPADHEELGKKIEASDFAAELIHRSRDTVRRLRLGAPDVFAGDDDDVLNPDPASDANTVAEYLDNTLPPEDVAEFERVCLSSGMVADMHLAEVTSSYHVLTMVLGEPAEIDTQARRRMYELPQTVEGGGSDEGGEKLRIEAAHPGVTIVDAAAIAPQFVVAQPVAERAEPSVAPVSENSALPDYLRVAADGRRRTRRLATLVALFVIGGIAAYLIAGAMEEPKVPDDVAAAIDQDVVREGADLSDIQIGDPVGAEPGSMTDDTSTSNAPSFVPKDVALPEVAALNEVEGQALADEEVSTEEAVDESATKAAALPPAADAAVSIAEPQLLGPADDGAAAAADTVTVPDSTDTEASAAIAATAASTPPTSKDLADAAAPILLPPQEGAAAAADSMADSRNDDPLDLSGSRAEEAVERAKNQEEDAKEAPPEPVGPKQVGVYVGNNDVLLRYLPDNEQWLRLPPRTSITGGDELLALPKYRTHVVLKNVNTYLSGGTQITVPDQDDSDNSSLTLEMAYGRLLLNAGLKGSKVIIKIGEYSRAFHLDNSASLAVDVHRIFVPGTNYEQVSAPVQVDWYLTTGSVEWPNGDGTTQIIKAKSMWKTAGEGDEAPEHIAELPNWIDREPMSELERRARDRFAEDLPVGQPVGLRLEELNDEQGAGREIRTLSAEASLYVGEFEPFIKSLNDSDQRIAWRSHINAMRQSMAMSPQVAIKLGEEFVNVRGREAGEDLMSMVRGFTPEQIGMTREELKQGVVLDLLRWLESDSLDYRVLAIYNLDEIKGTTNLKDYRPDGIPRTRAIAITKIRQMIENNEFLDLP